MSFPQHTEVILSSQLSSNAKGVAMVKRCVTRIQKAVEKFLNDDGHSELLLGYDKHESADFWKRMKSMTGGGVPPEFMSTRSAHDTRISDIEIWMPEAMKYYNGAQK